MGQKSSAIYGGVCYSDHTIGELIGCCELPIIRFGESTTFMDLFLIFLTV